MKLTKIGNFIAESRKAKGLTQFELAEKLNITDKAISRWETGKGLPDTLIMPKLCKELGISVNDLLSGERVDAKDYNARAEENLLELQMAYLDASKRLLGLDWVIGLMGTGAFLTIMFVVSYAEMEMAMRAVLIALGALLLVAACVSCLMIEQKTGFYECKNCGYRYVPTKNQVLWAQHIGRTRRMKCPNCGKRSWQKKVLMKDDYCEILKK